MTRFRFAFLANTFEINSTKAYTHGWRITFENDAGRSLDIWGSASSLVLAQKAIQASARRVISYGGKVLIEEVIQAEVI